MGFSSQDDLISEVTVNGKSCRCDWNKLTHATGAQAAGIWYALMHGTGNPQAFVFAGTNKAFTSVSDLDGCGLVTGGDVSPDTKHILDASAYSAAATTMPALAMLVDFLGYYQLSGTAITTGGSSDVALINSGTCTITNATDLITTATIDIPTGARVRFTNAGGALPAGLVAATDYWATRQSATTIKVSTTLALCRAGTFLDITTDGTGTQTIYVALPRYTDGTSVQAIFVPSVVMGAGTPNMQLGYTNAAGGTNRRTPATLPAMNATSPVGQISYSGTGAGKYGPFVPLAAADTGIRSVENFNLSATMTSGTGNLCLVKPLITLPMTTQGVPSEREFVNQLPSLPRVYDGACLVWLLYAGNSTPVSSAFFGHIDLGWG